VPAQPEQRLTFATVISWCGADVAEHLLAVAGACRQDMFLVGGAVRDWLREGHGRPHDLDFVISGGAAEFVRRLARGLGRGTVVDLGDLEDDTCRLVLPGLVIDVAGFRDGARSIEADLVRRDFTINALAVDLFLARRDGAAPVVDPLGGRKDLIRKVIRACPGAFRADPLRLLRGIRFAAQFDFSLAADTVVRIRGAAPRIGEVAVERIAVECDQIMASTRAARAFADLAAYGLLHHLMPDLAHGEGVRQPACHHLDVLQHNLETLACLEQVLRCPQAHFLQSWQSLAAAAAEQGDRVALKWAALFHDVGKPATRAGGDGETGRITFHRHDERGADLFRDFAHHFCWSRKRTERVARLIGMHMHPFHLCNIIRRDGEISRRALLKLCRRAGDDLPALFLLAMADTLAGRGVERPVTVETELATLYDQVAETYQTVIRPVLTGPKLLTGTDLIATVGLEPGPLFRELLEGVEAAVVEGTVQNREEALAWVRDRLQGEAGAMQNDIEPTAGGV
jgi:poly(A) polymerase